MKDNTPHFTRDDCPNKVVEWLSKNQEKNHAQLSEQLHDYHLELLDVKQTVINTQLGTRLLAVGLIVLFVLILTG